MTKMTATITLATLLLVVSICGTHAAQHCSVHKQIAPCSCRKDDSSRTTFINCERMASFKQVVLALQDHFNHDNPIALEVAYSQLDDLQEHSFDELKMSISYLKLQHNSINKVMGDTFFGLNRIDYLCLADNELSNVPKDMLLRIPTLKSLDIGRGKIKHITKSDFEHSPQLQFLVLPGNSIHTLEKGSLPNTLRHLHLGRNKIPDLNGTLRYMNRLEWLFINSNELESLDDQLPDENNKLILIHASDNKLQRLPKELKNLNTIESLFLEHNMLVGLDRTLSKAKRLQRLVLTHNRIQKISREDFSDSDSLEDLQLGFNNIAALNGSLHPLRGLKLVNLTHNSLTEFSLQEIRGLRHLRVVDLSHNKISKLRGIAEVSNAVELDIRVMELRLEHNMLYSLDGALSGLHGLIFLNLSHNHLSRIGPEDLVGLEELTTLDLSNNEITTLDETSKTMLVSLENFHVSHNMISELSRDFWGLPSLCTADLSYNQVRSVSRELVSRTKCTKNGSPAPLVLLLQDNPILCDSALPELISDLEVNNTRIWGSSNCEAFASKSQEAMPEEISIVAKTDNAAENVPNPTNTKYISVTENAAEVMVPPEIIEKIEEKVEQLQVVQEEIKNKVADLEKIEQKLNLIEIVGPALIEKIEKLEKMEHAERAERAGRLDAERNERNVHNERTEAPKVDVRTLERK